MACSRALGVESSRICWPGIALQTGFGYVTTTPANIGMQDAYFNIAMSTYGSGTVGLWNFSQSPYKPRIIVVNLGTNDAAQITGNTALLANFRTAYVNFIKKLRSYHPDAQIFVMRPVSIPYADVNTAIANAAQSVILDGDNKAHFIDTTGWTVEILSDGIHPSPAGHTQITNYLLPILQPYLASSTRVLSALPAPPAPIRCLLFSGRGHRASQSGLYRPRVAVMVKYQLNDGAHLRNRYHRRIHLFYDHGNQFRRQRKPDLYPRGI